MVYTGITYIEFINFTHDYKIHYHHIYLVVKVLNLN